MDTQQAVQNAMKNVQAATPANVNTMTADQQIADLQAKLAAALEIGRASCRERV